MMGTEQLNSQSGSFWALPCCPGCLEEKNCQANNLYASINPLDTPHRHLEKTIHYQLIALPPEDAAVALAAKNID